MNNISGMSRDDLMRLASVFRIPVTMSISDDDLRAVVRRAVQGEFGAVQPTYVDYSSGVHTAPVGSFQPPGALAMALSASAPTAAPPSAAASNPGNAGFTARMVDELDDTTVIHLSTANGLRVDGLPMVSVREMLKNHYRQTEAPTPPIAGAPAGPRPPQGGFSSINPLIKGTRFAQLRDAAHAVKSNPQLSATPPGFPPPVSPVDTFSSPVNVNQPKPSIFDTVKQLKVQKLVRTVVRSAAAKQRWQAPKKQIAIRHAQAVHPRKFDTQTMRLQKWPLCKTKTGRFCPRACACCDPFGEGELSELVVYGSGLTAYFKTLKWFAWLFFWLTLLALPAIVLNTFGTEDSASLGDIELYKTTIGHLGDDPNITVVRIPRTDCNGSECEISKETLAKIYAFLDVAGVVLVLMGYVWLSRLQRHEDVVVNQYSLTVDDYSIYVTNVPPDCTADEVQLHFEQIIGRGTIHRVSVVERAPKLLSEYLKRGKLIRQAHKADDKVKMLRFQGKRHKPAMLAREACKQKAEEVTTKILGMKNASSVCGVFVTFKHEADKVTCLNLYDRGTIPRWFQPTHLRFRERHRLRVSQAPAPSTVLWENLGVPWNTRVVLSMSTALVTLVVLAMSLAALIAASTQQDGNTITQCSADVSIYTKEAVDQDPALTDCFCQTLSTAEVIGESRCKKWLAQRTFAVGITLAASFSVVIVNAALNVIMKRLAVCERHHSMNSQARSFAFRLFLASFINTAIVVIVVNASIPFIEEFSDGVRFDDFETQWYVLVGTAILFTMILSIVTVHIAPFSRWALALCRRKHAKPRSQQDLNTLYTGPEFHLHLRYAQVMNMVFVALIFSAGMPVLLPIAMMWFFVAYWVDKVLVLRFYRSPVRFDTELGRYMIGWLPVAVVLHLGFAMWMYGNPAIFKSAKDSLAAYADNVGEQNLDFALNRAQQSHTIPLFVTMVVLLAWIIISSLFKAANTALLRMIQFISCGRCGKSKQEVTSAAEITFPEALSNGFIIGLPSYNILENPRFQEAFQVPASFAATHSKLQDIALYRVHARSKRAQRRETRFHQQAQRK